VYTDVHIDGQQGVSEEMWHCLKHVLGKHDLRADLELHHFGNLRILFHEFAGF
jgi:hypothetical protein